MKPIILAIFIGFPSAGCITAREAIPLPAFPGAEGFGAFAKGGRGGRVIQVTSRDDAGPGSLRAAIDAEGPRTIVFEVSGVIELRTELVLKNPFVTIAGQTAPEGGVTLTTHPSHSRSLLTITDGAHDVVIRHLRFRPAPPTGRPNPKDDSHVQDALQILDASNVIIDHCSFTWATDEVVSTFASAQDISIQWCIIAEGLLNRQRGGPDGKGLLVGGPKAQRISIHHNLLAHSVGRNPMIKAAGIVDVVNNVVLAPAATAIVVDGEYAKSPANLVGNIVLAPNGEGRVYGVRVLGPRPVSLYVSGNHGPKRTSDQEPEDAFVDPGNNSRTHLVDQRHEAPLVTAMPATAAFDAVLAGAGATAPVRDAVDERIVNDVRRGYCRLIGHPDEAGGLPAVPGRTAPEGHDRDRDGMPDLWENQHGLDPNDISDGGADADRDGYTNLEEFLNQTRPR